MEPFLWAGSGPFGYTLNVTQIKQLICCSITIVPFFKIPPSYSVFNTHNALSCRHSLKVVILYMFLLVFSIESWGIFQTCIKFIWQS